VLKIPIVLAADELEWLPIRPQVYLLPGRPGSRVRSTVIDRHVKNGLKSARVKRSITSSRGDWYCAGSDLSLDIVIVDEGSNDGRIAVAVGSTSFGDSNPVFTIHHKDLRATDAKGESAPDSFAWSVTSILTAFTGGKNRTGTPLIANFKPRPDWRVIRQWLDAIQLIQAA
jgi:hypothetical protein